MHQLPWNGAAERYSACIRSRHTAVGLPTGKMQWFPFQTAWWQKHTGRMVYLSVG